MERLVFCVSGRVQGVWFRRFTQRTAQRLKLTGWVRNRTDGRVEGQAEGDRQRLELFIAELQVGPPLARVDQLETRFLPAEWGVLLLRCSRLSQHALDAKNS